MSAQEPLAGVRTAISGLIAGQLQPIVDEWVEFARSKVPPSQDFTTDELADHAAVLLLAIAADLRDAQVPAKSQGGRCANAPDITQVARDHAEQRFVQGFTFDHLVSEFRALRASVLRRWTGQIDVPQQEDLDDLIRFGEAMDQALSASALLYAKKVEASRNLLLGVLGHDLRTPVGVIQMSATYLLRTDRLDGAQTQATARILTSSQRIAAMVTDILDFTQTAFGVTLPLTPAPADMGALARAIVTEVTALVPGSRVELSTEGDLTGRWDGSRISQMLSNLLANAVQHGDRTQAVTVRAWDDGPQVRLEVSNAGIPIGHQALKTLFLPLRQAPAAEGERRTGSSGLGLGLYITREIALAHGGQVEVESTSDGTTFSVRLPRTPPRSKDRRAASIARLAADRAEPPSTNPALY